MRRILFTIFTPVYNRAYILPVLYDSLRRQTCKNFEWMIVDDGSEDNLQTLVQEWMCKEDNEFEIRYFRKENGGKPRAINYGVERAAGDYFLIMDSDDYFTPDAVEKFERWVLEIQKEPHLIGAAGARGNSEGKYLKGSPPMVNRYGFIDASNLERAAYNLDADMTEAYRTEVLKRFPMAEWPGEKFAPEQIAMNEMALAGYRLRWHRDIVCVCEYLQDGLTKGSSLLEKENPMGYAMMYNHRLKYDLSRKEKWKAAVQCTALCIYAGHPEYLLKTFNWKYMVLSIPCGMILSCRRRWQYRRID